MVTKRSPAAVAAAQSATPTEQDAFEIGMEAYLYFYSLVTMEVTRRQMTNTGAGKVMGFGPMNELHHTRSYPSADMKAVVRPNFDTLYSIAWVDLRKEPMILSVPDTRGRYYMMPMLDMWTNVFAAPGKRTSGTRAGHFAMVPPGWKGTLPGGVARIDAPTPIAWIIGRIQTNGPADYPAVHAIQDQMKLTPLSCWGKAVPPAAADIDEAVDMKTPPLTQVNRMPAGAFFQYAANLLKLHPPQLTDWSTLARLRRIGIEAGEPFDIAGVGPAVEAALERVPAAALASMQKKLPTLGRLVNGWSMSTDTMGVYGNYYLKRAIVAMVGLGANEPADAIYPLNLGDADGKPVNGDNKYVLRFARDELPPVDAFWSLTMYDAEGFQVANAINRFAVSSWMPFKYNADGSLDLYIQQESPGAGKEANWLPAPAGPLGMTLRLYWPRAEALDGGWTPPPVKRVQ